MIGRESIKALNTELKNALGMVTSILDELPKEQRKSHKEFFDNYLELLTEGRNVEAEALANKYKAENGN